MAIPRHVGGEHSDLAIGDLARRASVLACNPARGLALFQKAGLIDDQNRVLIAKCFQRVLTYNVAQRVGVPLPPAQDRLLAPRAWIAGRFRPHPTRLTRLVAQQSVEKLPRRGCDPLLRKQRTDALLGISQRRSPQRQRIFNRRATNHQIPNHGHPWIQNSPKIATVMLDEAGDYFFGCFTLISLGPLDGGASWIRPATVARPRRACFFYGALLGSDSRKRRRSSFRMSVRFPN